MSRALRLAGLAAALLVALVPKAFAWGPDGHRIVAQIAAEHLQPGTRAAVAALLDGEPEPSLAGIANWADEVREPLDGPLHYLNFPDGDCQYQPRRDCPRGQCVVAAIERAAKTLKRDKASRTQKQVALKQLVHFIGDIHQPLHAGRKADRGGNLVQLRWRGRGSNLHQLWDSGLIASLEPDWQRYLRRLEPVALRLEPGSPQTADWAMESCAIVASDGFYPDSGKPGLAYRDRWQGVLEQRLMLAGLRLAATLNRLLAD